MLKMLVSIGLALLPIAVVLFMLYIEIRKVRRQRAANAAHLEQFKLEAEKLLTTSRAINVRQRNP